jgi:ectoine hydroxylase-related dioxygenase (phytanoyl-CoA dioxygenase family)
MLPSKLLTTDQRIFANPELVMPIIPRFRADAGVTDVVTAIKESGCVIIDRLLPEAALRALAQLEPEFARTPRSSGTFTGLNTKRLMRLITRVPACREMILHPLLQASLSELFRQEAYHHQLHATEAVRIEPGEKAQSLHRDDGTYPFRHPCPPCVINTIWALDDFTIENGATRLVVGSHRWDDERRPEEAETVPALMPRGSVLLIDGGLHHGGGQNTNSSSRTALLLSFSLGWLRPSENPQLAVPPHEAKDLPKALQDLLGYRTHGFLGVFDGTQPSASWQQASTQHHAAEDLYTSELEALSIRRR